MATVLIADDDAAVRRLLLSLLGPRGYRVIEAANGEEALALARAERPGVIVSDLMMPNMDGYELVRRLRATPETASIAVIFLTAEYADDASAELARAGGVVQVLRKPCPPGDILAAVDDALGRAPDVDANELTGSYGVRHLRLMTDKLTQQATDLRTANDRLEAHAAQLQTEVAERKLAGEKLAQLNRVHGMLSSINGLIVRVKEREALLAGACRAAVEHGLFRMAWVGLLSSDGNEINPVASEGADDTFIPLLDRPRALYAGPKRSLVSEAVASQQPAVCNDLERNVDNVVFGADLVAAGYRSSAVLPLTVDSRAVGVFALYTRERGFFDAGETRLLLELAGNISFALDHISKTERLDYLAYYDALTGLANRALLLQRLSRDLDAGTASGHKLALVIIDINRFENVNDTFGRQVGDQVLKAVAERLSASLGDESRAARVGPDEIAAFISDVHSENDAARAVSERLQRVFAMPVQTGATELRVTGKAGIALFPNDGTDAETLLRHAQAALKKCKASTDPYLFYTQDMSVRTAERLALESKLRDGLEREQFVLHYQPKVDGASGRLVGLEALIRWQSPDLALVPPSQFIPLMEETGLIVEAGRWVLRQVIADRWRWIESGLRPPRIAINVSTVELRKQDFVRGFSQALKLGGEDHGIDIEVTESLIIEDVDANIRKLAAIRDLGVTIAIDDFGTGYSSLAYLARLPVQTLKIDGSFIASMLDDASAMTLVSMMISLARSLKLTCVAEGVENDEQARMLRLLRCDQLQGFLLGRPAPFDEITERLRRTRN